MNNEIKERITKIQNGEIPKGYKKTKVGIVPSEWEVKKLGEVAKTYSGGTPNTNNKEYYLGTIPFIRSAEIDKKRTELFISKQGLNSSSAKEVIVGDLLYALYGANSGECAISKQCGAINQAVLCIKSSENVKYLYYFLSSNKIKIINTYLQGGQGNLSAQIMKNIKLPLPPLPEQNTIAEILSTEDKVIELKEKLIEKKEAQKKYLMQNLLTGKKRLTGFRGEWNKVRLGEVCEIIKGSQLNKNTLSEYDKYYVLNGGITPSGYTDNWNVEKNTISISEGGNSCGFVNYNTENFWSGGHCYTLQDLSINMENLFLYFTLKYKQQTLMELRVGSGLPNIQKKSLLNFKVNLPPLDEQKTIAEILSTANKEIELLKADLEKEKEKKKALMQLLLTGIVRV